MTRITLDHLIGGFKTSIRDFCHVELLMKSFFGGNNRGIGHKRKMNPGIRDQICLKLSKVNIEGAIETERCGD